MWTAIYWLIVFGAGVLAGYFLKSWLFYRFQNYVGTIVVSTDARSEKTVYSLVLDEYPEKLQFEKVVVFKVDSPKKNPDRE